MQDSEVPFFTASGFADLAGEKVFHGFFGRRGGVSTGIYARLNCGDGSDDSPESILENRKRVARTVGTEPAQLLSLYQHHSADCIVVEELWHAREKPKADAMVTDRPGVALGILTADCAPVLFFGTKADGAPVIGAAHAGWRGALGGVLASTVEKMSTLGADVATIEACVGPCIGKASYEVDQGFFEDFVRHDDLYERFFGAAAKAGHYMFDLAGFCALRLSEAGVGQVYIKDLDTYFNEEDFFSYRRKTHRDEKDYGRQVSAIMIAAD